MNKDLSTTQQLFALLEGNALVILPSLAVIYATKKARRTYQFSEANLPISFFSIPHFNNFTAVVETVFTQLRPDHRTITEAFCDANQKNWKVNFIGIFDTREKLEYIVLKFKLSPTISPPIVKNNTSDKQPLSLADLSAADLRQLLSNGVQMSVLYRIDGTPLYFSRQVETFTGLSQSELAERMFEYLIYPENRAEVHQHFTMQLRRNEAFTTELFVRRKDGVYRWLEGQMTPIKNAKGEVVKWVGNFYDIHERKEHDRLLTEQINKIDNITRFLPQIVWMLDPNGLPSFFNHRWYYYTGLSENESMSRNWLKVIHKSDQHLINELFVLAQTEGEIANRELRMISKENEYHWFLCQVIPIQNSIGDIAQWLGTFTDINEQKQMEQQKDEFINIASHELKTPLTSIKAYLDIAKNYVEDKNPLWLYVNGARKGTERLNNLISSLLDVTRLTELVDVSRFESFSLQIFLEDTVETFRGAYPKRNINLRGTTQVPIYGDQQRIGQVLNNLLTNAIKHTPPHSSIEVQIRQKNVNFVEITVQDWGMGIPQKELKNIFKRYYRVNHKRHVSGFGLGLYICKKIVEAHGGWIFAESQLREGTKVIFTLPISINPKD